MGKKPSLIIKLDTYAGNHEREVLSFLFGTGDDNNTSEGVRLISEWDRDVSDEDKNWVTDVTDRRPYDEYGYQTCGLAPDDIDAVEIYLDPYLLDDPERLEKVLDFVKRRIGPESIINYHSYNNQLVSVRVLETRLRIVSSRSKDTIF
jgi:hypothetical protein